MAAGKIGRVGKRRTKSSAKKRVSITGSGRLKINKPAHNHLLLQKSKAKKREAANPVMLSKADTKNVAPLLSF